jgi:hypothetical protein
VAASCAVAVTGGVRTTVAGHFISATNALRQLLLAALTTGVRHYAFRRPTLAGRAGSVLSVVIRSLGPHTLIRLLLSGAICSLFYLSFNNRLPFYGDAPHYLITTISVVNDMDFNGLNQYAQDDGRLIGYPGLRAQDRPVKGYLAPEHGEGFPLFLAAFYTIGGLSFVKVVLFLVGWLTTLLVGMNCDLAGYPRATGTCATVLLSLMPTWLIFSNQVYPEVVAGFLLTLSTFFLLRAARDHAVHLELAAGLTLGCLPFLYQRYIVLAAPLLLVSLLLPSIRRSLWYWLGMLTVAICAATIWHEVHGSFFASGVETATSSHFKLAGSQLRVWYAWFERYHGLVVLQPVTLLVFWLAPQLLAPALRRDRRFLRHALVFPLAAYTAIYGLWTLGPGGSLTGRYLCAALPLMCSIVAIGIAEVRHSIGKWLLLAGATALAAVSAYFVIVSLHSATLIYDAPSHAWYRLFPIEWGRPPHMRRYEDPLPVLLNWSTIGGLMFAMTVAGGIQMGYRWYRRATAASPDPAS